MNRIATPLFAVLIAGLLPITTGPPVTAAEEPAAGGWTLEQVEASGIGRAFLPGLDLDIARDGRLVAVGVRSSPDLSRAGLAVLERRPDQGWKVLAVTRAMDGDPSLALARGGAIHIAFDREGTRVGLRYTTNRTGRWAVESLPGTVDGYRPSLALTPGGSPSIAFERHARTGPAGIAIVSKTTAGWRTRTVTSGTDERPSLAIDRDGKRHLVFVRRSGSPGIYYATDRSGAWRTTRLTRSATDQAPRIVLDLDGMAHVAFTGSSAAGSAIRYATNPRGTWRIVDTTLAAGGQPELALDPAGRPVLAAVSAVGLPGSAGLLVAESIGGSFVASTVGQGFTGAVALAVDAAGRPHVVGLQTIGLDDGYLVHAVR